jgi:hypothetical protein
MNYRKKDIDYFYNKVGSSSLKLDKDEKDQSFFLLKGKGNLPEVTYVEHVEKIHIHPATCDPNLYPKQFREGLLSILEKYANGYCKLEGEAWVSLEKSEVMSCQSGFIQ